MTGQSLFYMGEADLASTRCSPWPKRRVRSAPHTRLKLLQSEGELTIASTGKDPSVGSSHVTHEYRVEGPVAIMLTTTAIDVDEELLNRCLVLSVDEAREQTRAIHAAAARAAHARRACWRGRGARIGDVRLHQQRPTAAASAGRRSTPSPTRLTFRRRRRPVPAPRS